MHEIELRPSRQLAVLQVGVLLLALVAVVQAAMPAGLKLAAALGLVGLWLRERRRRPHPGTLRLAADGRLQAVDDAAAWRDVEVLGDSFVAPALIVLRYRIPGQPARSLALLPDSADAESLRRLRVSLRWGRHRRSDTAFRDGG
jgi:toxin CptA